MVTDLVEVLLPNVDNSNDPPGLPSIHAHLNTPTPPINFRQLQDRFIDYVRRYSHGEIPTALGCIFEAGGVNSIKNWCRKNQSYGFSGPNTRLSETVYQSKMSLWSPPALLENQKVNRYSQDFVQINKEPVVQENNIKI